MKKIGRTALLGLGLALALCVPAMAQTTGISVDGKTYTFSGGEGTYEVDGKMFLIDAETVTIQEIGKPERVYPITRSAEAELVEDTSTVFIQRSAEGASVSATESIAGPITKYVESSFFVESADISATAGTEYAQSSYAAEIGRTDPTRFEPYAKFGLRYDASTDSLTYQGRRVRIFEDSYPLDDQSCAALEHVDAQGTVDVKARRDLSARIYNADGSFDPAGTLTSLYALSDAEFAARNLSDWTQPKREVTAVSGEEMTPTERQAFYAPYAAFGLTYDATTDTLCYLGKRVREFLDIRQSNGEALNSEIFQGVMTCIGGEDGEVDVQTIRDYSKPDAAGDGLLVGMSSEDVR